MDFLPRELIAQLELYQHSFHETILCLLGTPHCFSHLSLLVSLTSLCFLTLHLKSELWLCYKLQVCSGISSALDWATESWAPRPAPAPLPATAPLSTLSMFRPVSPEPRVPSSSPGPACGQWSIAQPLPVLARHMELTVTTKTISSWMRKVL